MRTKKEILKEVMPEFSIVNRLILEVFVDIRDILNERLLEIDRGIDGLISGFNKKNRKSP